MIRRRTFLGGVALCAALPLFGRARAAEPSPITALVGGQLIDGSGGDPLADSVVLIEGERISAIGTVVLRTGMCEPSAFTSLSSLWFAAASGPAARRCKSSERPKRSR